MLYDLGGFVRDQVVPPSRHRNEPLVLGRSLLLEAFGAIKSGDPVLRVVEYKEGEFRCGRFRLFFFWYAAHVGGSRRAWPNLAPYRLTASLS